MRRLLAAMAVAVAAVGAGAPAAVAQTKDTPAAAFTRTKKLKGKVTVDFKNEFLKDTFAEMSSQLEDQKLGTISVAYAQGVSQNTRVTFAAKDVTVEEALDGILKQLDLGYVVVSKEKDRYDGWLRIAKGPERGYEAGQEPKGTAVAKLDPKKPEPKKPDQEEMKKPEEPAKPVVKPDPAPADPAAPAASPEDEKLAAAKLALAKQLIEGGKADSAKIQLKFVVKKYPTTKAAAEAKALLEGDK